LPTILVIHLKRFHYAGPWRDKLNTFIDYPMQNLDLTKYVLGGTAGSKSPQPEKSEKYLYDLYAVTNHFGTLSGGHCPSPLLYTADWQILLVYITSCVGSGMCLMTAESLNARIPQLW
jgi:ubiquitin C-terminal hydrolase